VFNLNTVRIEKASLSSEHLNIVAVVEAAAHVDLLVDDSLSTAAEVSETDIQFDTELSEDGGGIDIHQPVDGCSQGFAGDCAKVGACAADPRHAFDGADSFTLFGCLHGGTFAARAGADNDDVELFVCWMLHGIA
jgi:hypothetical protein